MSGWIVALALMQTAPDAAAVETGDDIIVVARPQGCITRLADTTLSDRQFNERAREWAAGRPVRVIARADADIKCLSKIAFQLADRGVRTMEFIDPRGRAPLPIKGLPTRSNGSSTSGRSEAEPDLQERERRFNATRAARLILQGKCSEARDLVLNGGDLAAAADVVQICRAQ